MDAPRNVSEWLRRYVRPPRPSAPDPHSVAELLEHIPLDDGAGHAIRWSRREARHLLFVFWLLDHPGRRLMYDHQSQYQPGASFITRTSGCTWTSLANGIAATTGGTHRPTPDQIHELVPRNEETSPTTPGWSLTDAALAASRYGMSLVDHTGDGWEGVKAAHASGHYVLLQGDSDQFGNATCSGAFNGDHCIGVHPRTKVEAGVTYWWIDDPICPTGRWEDVKVLKRYAEKLWQRTRFAAFLQNVPDPKWEVRIPAGTALRLFTVEGGVITHVQIRKKPWTAVVKPCSAPRDKPYPWPGHTARKLVKLQDGAWVLDQYAHEVEA